MLSICDMENSPDTSAGDCFSESSSLSVDYHRNWTSAMFEYIDFQNHLLEEPFAMEVATPACLFDLIHCTTCADARGVQKVNVDEYPGSSIDQDRAVVDSGIRSRSLSEENSSVDPSHNSAPIQTDPEASGEVPSDSVSTLREVRRQLT